MIKLTISHAIAQSVKLTLFEELIDTAIASMTHIPNIMAETGKIHLRRKEINMKIGQLFIMRINVNLVSNVLGKKYNYSFLLFFFPLSGNLKLLYFLFFVVYNMRIMPLTSHFFLSLSLSFFRYTGNILV